MAENEQQQKPEADQVEEVQEEASLLDQIIDEGKMALDESHRELAKDLLSEFVSQIMEGAMVVSKDTEAMINTRRVVRGERTELDTPEEDEAIGGRRVERGRPGQQLDMLVPQDGDIGQERQIRVAQTDTGDIPPEAEVGI